MKKRQKPTFTVLPGSKATDFDALVALYKTVAGRDPTPAELAKARATFDAANEKT